jgi:predicted ABC-type transport system involved in lysophospholipase L1 biosynthesis ATPase subunit
LLLELQQDEQIMIILVTHSLELAARCQRQVELEAGQLKPGPHKILIER